MTKALAGIKILDLTRLLPGAICSMLLGDMGADVIKVEDPYAGDYARITPPLIDGMGAFFRSSNRNKRSIVIDLKQGEQKKHVARALKELRDGYVIVAPLEHGYVYLADAFSPYSVRAMHVLRKDADGIAAQVLAHSAQTVAGIARDISDETNALMSEFWPGLLSLNLKPMRALTWDLGDDTELDLFSVRVPKSKFVKAILPKLLLCKLFSEIT